MFDNLTDEQITYIRKMCDAVHTSLTKRLKGDPNNLQLQIDVCG